jgi:zinc D-Ala-D-Ala dipeptidase
VVGDVSIYERIVKADPDNEIIDLQPLIPSAKLDCRYATTNNLVHRKLYPTAVAFMRKPAAYALQHAAEVLSAQGYGLLLHDGYRPYEVTCIFYEVIKDTTFVADPHKGSKHNRGMAIDLSLYHLSTGEPVVMPSEYDETTERAFQKYISPIADANKHKSILKQALLDVGFIENQWEWWHFDYRGWESCYTYDLWHEDIRKANEAMKSK